MAKTTSATKKRARSAKPRSIGAEIIEGLSEAIQFESGATTGATFRAAPISARNASIAAAPSFSAQEIADLRKSLNVTQPIFAQALDVSAETVKAWEQGKFPPQGPARRLLQIARKHPDILLEGIVLTSQAKSTQSAGKTQSDRRSGSDRRGTVK
jgi:putative transcriptional regulator